MVCLKLRYTIYPIKVFDINVNLMAVDVFLPMAIQLQNDQKLSNSDNNLVILKLIRCNLVKRVAMF